MESPTQAGHIREHDSVFAHVEKNKLVWIVERLQPWVNSDHLTVLGLGAMAVAGAAYWASRLHPAALFVVVGALAVNWFGDSLDGTVARVRNHQRPNYGFYVDHVVDVVGAFFLFGGLALSPHASPVVALLLLVVFLMLSAEVYLATHAGGVFRISMFMVGPTELRICLSIGTLYLFVKPVVVVGGTSYLLFDVGGVVAIVGMLVALIVSTTRNTMILYRAEPLPVAQAEADRWVSETRRVA